MSGIDVTFFLYSPREPASTESHPIGVMNMVWFRPPKHNQTFTGAGKGDPMSMKRLLAIGFLCALLLLNVGIAAAAGTAPITNSTANVSPTLTENIASAIQTFITGVITPAPTPVPPEGVKQAVSPVLPAPAKAKIPAVKMPVPKINPVIEKAVNEHGVMRMHNITTAQREAAANQAAALGLKVRTTTIAPVTKGAVANIANAPVSVTALVTPCGEGLRTISVRTRTML